MQFVDYNLDSAVWCLFSVIYYNKSHSVSLPLHIKYEYILFITYSDQSFPIILRLFVLTFTYSQGNVIAVFDLVNNNYNLSPCISTRTQIQNSSKPRSNM